MRGGRHNISRLAACGILGLAVLLTTGCTAVLVGGAVAGGAAAGYAYYRGSVHQDFNDSFEHTWAATHAALHDMKLPVTSQDLAGERGEIHCRGPAGENIGIYLEDASPLERIVLTRVHIRVGVFGDQTLSQQIHAQITSRLQHQPGAPATTPAETNGSNAPAPVGVVPAATPLPVETAAPPVAN